MSATKFMSKASAALAAAVLAVALTAGSVLAATQFEGTWKTQDTKGNPFEITLSEGGKATGNRADEGLTGTWKAEGDSAVITWDSGWTTKLTKEGDQFKKLAFEKGETGTPSHTADAEKSSRRIFKRGAA